MVNIMAVKEHWRKIKFNIFFNKYPKLDDELVRNMKLYMGEKLNVKENKADRHAVLAICGTWLFLTFPRIVFASVTSSLKNDLNLDNADISELLLLQTIAFFLGKLFNGMLADSFDARYVLLVFMTISMFSCFGWSYTNNKYSMFPFIFLNMYCQSGIYPCMVKLVYNWFDANAFKRTLSLLALAKEVGTFLTLLIMGLIVSATGWRWTVFVASSIGGLGIIFALYMMRNLTAPSKREDHRSMTGIEQGRGCRSLCNAIYKSAQFWFCLLVISMMSILKGIENYMALWLTDIFRPCTSTNSSNCDSVLNSGHAAIVSSLLPLGTIISLIYGQFFLEDVHPKKEAKANVSLLYGITFSTLALAVWTTLVELGTRPKKNPWYWVGPVTVFILLYGFCIGYTYWVPINVYSVKVGGMNAATLNSTIDFVGNAFLSIFIFFGISLSEFEGDSETARSTWRYTFYFMLGAAQFSALTMFGFQYYNLKSLKNTNLLKRVTTFISLRNSDIGDTQIL